MDTNKEITRRAFLQTSALTLGGLVVAFHIPFALKKAFAAEAAAAGLEPNAFVHIAPDGTITLIINKLEMGQGVNTSMAQLIAEELECDWTKIRSVSAPVAPVYNHTTFGMQMTGGSSALASSWEQHRKVGATMRELLKNAAAQKWDVPVSEVSAKNGFIVHAKKGKLSYGELAESAAKLPAPQNVPLKKSSEYKVIGQSKKRVDAADKSNGKAVFGMDVRVPGMLYAVVAWPPGPKAKFLSMDEKAARAVSGVVDVVKFGDRVAVLGKNTFAAKAGRDALAAQWKADASLSHEALMQDFRKQADGKGLVAEEKGNAEQALAKAKTKLQAEYEFPFLAHAPMEPLNCTVSYDGKTAEIWSGHQMPTIDQQTAAQVLGLKPEQVTVNTVYAGGSFGRRANKNSDYIVAACELAKVVKKPLKLVYTREDDTRAGYYRPMNFHRVTVGVGEDKKLSGWNHRLVGQSVIGGSVFEPMMVKNGIEATVSEGITESKYELPDFRCEVTRAETPLTTLWWRSVGHTHTAYVMETMMDELAEATGKDPLKMRKEMLQKSPRHLAVLDLLAKQTGWGTKKPPKGRAWGLAVHESFNSVVGQIAEISLDEKMPKVHRVWAAVHCGQVVNPESAKTQVEGAIVYGLSAALRGEIRLEGGEIQNGNFIDYPVMRIQDMPKVNVEFVKTDDAPTGLGEPGLPPIAPAVANAYYKLTKKRLRKLPWSKELEA
ncbi:MAG: molybdopterin cofactor-binding domain-containing protein [Bacteriovoracia bacterium]